MLVTVMSLPISHVRHGRKRKDLADVGVHDRPLAVRGEVRAQLRGDGLEDLEREQREVHRVPHDQHVPRTGGLPGVLECVDHT